MGEGERRRFNSLKKLVRVDKKTRKRKLWANLPLRESGNGVVSMLFF